MLALVCPGQGAQSPGMLSAWLDLPAFAASIAESSEASGLDLVHLGTVADAETIRDTAIAQPLLVATALASYAELGIEPGLTAGHSVGEFAAAAIAGVLTPNDAVALVRGRGLAMAKAASEAVATSMAAVLGGETDVVLAAIEALGLVAANMNGAGQIVAAGALDAVETLVANPPEKARVIQLQVAGAFHTHFMQPAVEALAAAAASVATNDPSLQLLSNADGGTVASGREAIDRMVAQVARPVRWDLCMQAMLSAPVSGIIEVAPGGVLSGLAKRAMREVPAVALKSPADLEAARELARSVA